MNLPPMNRSAGWWGSIILIVVGSSTDSKTALIIGTICLVLALFGDEK